MGPLVLIVLGAIVLVLVIVALSAIRVVQQYERGVIFVLGRLIGAKGPGLFLVPPFISRMVKVDLRIVTLTVPPQEVELPATMQRQAGEAVHEPLNGSRTNEPSLTR
jgi:regulator of protease activity HflC (stomatin/prohibitin superfamily)